MFETNCASIRWSTSRINVLTFENEVLPGAVVSIRDLNLLLLQEAELGLVLCCTIVTNYGCTWSPLLKCTPLSRFYPASPGHDCDLVPSPSRNYRQQKKRRKTRIARCLVAIIISELKQERCQRHRDHLQKIKFHDSAVIICLFQIIWFAKSALATLEWNCRLEIERRQMPSTLVNRELKQTRRRQKQERHLKTSHFCNHFSIIQGHYAWKMCSNYPENK